MPSLFIEHSPEHWRFGTVETSLFFEDMGVSKNRGTRKIMVYNGKPIKIDDLGVTLFLEPSIYCPFSGANLLLVSGR